MSKITTKLNRLTGLALALAITAPCVVAQQAQPAQPQQSAAQLPLAPEEALLRVIPYFSQDAQPISKVLQALGRSYGVSVICDKDVTGDVDVEFHNITLRGVLDALCFSEGYYWNLEEGGYVSVRRFKTIMYQIEYPQLERKGSSKSSINLGSTNYTPQNSGSGGGGGGGRGGGGGGSNQTEDTAEISIDQTSEGKFWQSLEKEVQDVKQKEEKIIFDRFSGTILATASRRTHEHIEMFISNVNARIGQQVEIIAKLVEVELTDQNQLGIDWAQAATSIGGIKISGAVSTIEGMPTPAGGADAIGNTISATISSGRLTSVIKALSQQGNMHTVTAPRLVTVNNQTAYIKDTTDKPYFQRTSSTRQSLAGSDATVLSDATFSVTSISIGTIVAITPHIADNGDITLDIIPAITRWIRDVESKDGFSSAPELAVKMASTIVRLRSGETAIIGGIISETESGSTRKVPGLGSIPLVGRLFRTEGKYKGRSELVIFLTPRILVPGSSLTVREIQQAERDSRAVRSVTRGGVHSTTSSAPSSGSSVESISLLGDGF